ncbi:MAG: PEP-CTERM sorting domain-containing protein [Luteolibacter sp.]
MKLKTLIFGLLLASPAFAVWASRSSERTVPPAQIRSVSYPPGNNSASEGVVRIPIEVIEKGSAPKMIYVEHIAQAVPEPGIISLLTLTSLFLAFRRQR